MKTNNLILCLLLILTVSISCSKSSEPDPTPTPTPTSLKITLSPSTVFQTISGFGGANRMWGSYSLTPSEAVKAFGTADNQLGLSIFRVRLSSNRAEWPIIVESVKEANKYGVKVMACPWSPPAALKNNNSDIRGNLLPEKYTAFKDYINEFIAFMTANGAKIDVVSIQNEPDYAAAYESCDYTSQQMIAFLNSPGTITGVKVAAPETYNFNQTYTNAVLNDATASQKIDIVAGHIYGGGIAKFPLAEQKNKEIWMSEFLLNLNTGNPGAASWSTYNESAKWVESLSMLTSVHNSMISNWNAYIWWYLKRYYSFMGDGEEGTQDGVILKRGIAFSHYSKFVRPGFVRIDTSLPTTSTLKLTAYKKDNQTIIVIVNPETIAVSNIQFSGLIPTSAISYTTSETLSMLKKQLTITNNVFSFDVLPKSVSTIVITN